MSQNSGPSAYNLLLSSSQGDIEAFSSLFELYSSKLFNFAYYLTYSKEDAEDITSETFISVYQAIQGRDVTNFNLQAYLYKTAKSASLKSIQRRKREGLTMEETMAFSDPGIFADPERAALLSEQRELVRQTSEELTLDQQSALLLKELEGLPYDTIAQVLDSNPNAVGALLSRARLKFREAFRMAHVSEPMTDECTALLPLMSKYIDSEASPEEQELVRAHLATCPICNENLTSMSEASITYRSLIPFLPLATLKVWSMAKAAIAGKAVITAASAAGSAAGGGGSSAGGAAASGGAAAAGAGAAATAATVGTAAGLGVMTKILIVAATVLVLGGAGTGGYIALKATVFAKKTVPTVVGLKQDEAEKKIQNAGLKSRVAFVHPDWPKTGNEVVSKQDPAKDTKLDNGQIVTITIEDKDFAAGRALAEQQIGIAKQKMGEASASGIEVADLAPTLQASQAKHDAATTVGQLVNDPDSSTNLANMVIQQCDSRLVTFKAEKERVRAQAERNRQIAAAKAAIMAYMNRRSPPTAGKEWRFVGNQENMNSDNTLFEGGGVEVFNIADGTQAANSDYNAFRVQRVGDNWTVTHYQDASDDNWYPL